MAHTSLLHLGHIGLIIQIFILPSKVWYIAQGGQFYIISINKRSAVQVSKPQNITTKRKISWHY
jgi:hypothetical protein